MRLDGNHDRLEGSDVGEAAEARTRTLTPPPFEQNLCPKLVLSKILSVTRFSAILRHFCVVNLWMQKTEFLGGRSRGGGGGLRPL